MLPRPHPAVLLQTVSDGAVLLHTEQEVYFGLNAVGVEIWKLLPPAHSDLDGMCEQLARQYPGVSVAELRGDVSELLDVLAAEGLVVPADSAQE